MPVSYDTGIMIGEPGESYIYIEPDSGKAFRRAVVSQLRSDGAHQNLGDSKHDVSSATLWLTGNWNAITLDGSPDGSYLVTNAHF